MFSAIWAGIKLIAGKKIVQQAAVAGASQVLGATLTRRSAKKEAARVAAANRAEAARIQKANAAAAASARKQNTQVRQNYYKNVVSDAQAAGINPLTALRTGGGAGYATAVAGTMSNPVMMEGVYQAPTLSRNPLAAGLEAATNTYLSELTRQKQYSHESRMDELNKSLMRAQIKGITAELSRETPESVPLGIRDKHGNMMFAAETEFETVPKYIYVRDQTDGSIYPILNPELTESGPTEMATGIATMEAAEKLHSSSGLFDPAGFKKKIRQRGEDWGVKAYPIGRTVR